MAPQKTLSPRALFELLLLGLIWGASFLSIRLALDEVSVLSSVLHRVGWAALALWAFALWSGLRITLSRRLLIGCLGMGVLNNVLPFTLMAWAQVHIETGLTSILNSTTALFGVLVAALFLPDERLTLRKLGGIALGMGGVVMVIGTDLLGALDLAAGAQVAVLAGTLSYAFAGVWARRFLGDVPPLVAAAGMLTASTLILLPVTLVLEGGVDLPHSATGAAAIAYYALAATAAAYLLYYRVLAMAGSGNLMLVTLVIPPVAVTLGALILNERLTAADLAGFALIAGALLILRGRARKSP